MGEEQEAKRLPREAVKFAFINRQKQPQFLSVSLPYTSSASFSTSQCPLPHPVTQLCGWCLGRTGVRAQQSGSE